MKTPYFIILFHLLFTILIMPLHAQNESSVSGDNPQKAASENIYIKLKPTLLLGRIQDGQLWVDDKTVLFSMQGNLIFDATSTHYDDIVLMAGTDDFFGRRASRVYFKDGKKVAYTIKRGSFYLGDNLDSDHYLGAIRMNEQDNKRFDVISAESDSLLGWIESNSVPQPIEFISIFHLFLIQFDLDNQLNDRLNSQQTQQLEDENYPEGGGIIRPMLGGNSYYEWIWDGHVLKPAWGIRSEDEWTFDGRILKPAWGRDVQEEWTWNGKIMRRTFATNTQDEWIWEGQMLKPYWDNDPDKQWRFDGQTLRPWWNSATNLRWTVEGNIPLPVLAIVVLGIADR